MRHDRRRSHARITMRERIGFAVVVVAATLCGSPHANADAVEDFYKGRTIDMTVPGSAGGDYDLRARMVAASFLVKHLLVDWRVGEAHFLRELEDGDVANNLLGWRWVAGVGPDAAPFIRILFQCDAVRGDISRSMASSVSLLSVPTSWPKMSSTRCIARPAFSSATTVLSKVGGSGFPVIAAVFLFRSFMFEPFKIPSSSMVPTLQIGDLILVNKYTYGIRLPIVNKKIISINNPSRGDVMVFRYPPHPSLDYIKRVIGVPGDEIAYFNKQLTVNGQPVPKAALPNFFDEDTLRYAKQFSEQLPTGVDAAHPGPVKTVHILNDDERPAFIPGADEFAFKDQCRYSVQGVVCKVPPGHYFMMGDNRDNSLDSRYWGFVPEANIVGKAFFVWMNFGHFNRIGGFD